MNKKTLRSILFVTLLMTILVLPFFIYAQDEGGPTVTAMANRVKVVLITVGNAVVLIGWVWAGILWLTSGGSPEKTGTAKKAIIACVIGTILIILADSEAILGVLSDAFSLW